MKDVKYPLHKALFKYGIENFTIAIIGSYESEQDAFNNEIETISKLKLEGYILYNLTNGGEGCSGYIFSEETVKKLSKLATGNTNSLGAKRSDETKQKISLANKGQKHKQIKKDKLIDANDINNKEVIVTPTGRYRTKGHNYKIALSLKGKNHTEETKRNMSLAYNRKFSDETRLKITMSQVGDKNHSAKLTWNEVNEIRKLFSEGKQYKELSIQFKVNKNTIGNICRNKSWIKCG